MSIYRRKSLYKGKTRRSDFYTAEFTYRGQLYRRGGFVDRDHARDWVTAESNKLRRGATGYTKPMPKARLLTSGGDVGLIERYVEHMTGRGLDPHYVYITEQRLKRLCSEAGWLTIGDISEQSLLLWLRSDSFWANRPTKPIKPKTKNQYLDTAYTFCRWLVKPERKLAANPLDGIDRLKVLENKGYRRAGSVDELDKLLATCPKERRAFYVFRLYCPLRARTYQQLTWRMLHLDAEQPWILLPAAINKSRKDERSPLPLHVAQMLRRERGKAKADDLVFEPCPTLDDLKADLATAGILFDDGKGARRLDLHAFRKTLVRLCKRAGVSMDDAGALLHHKDPATTRRHYDDDGVDPDLTIAVSKLPVIGKMKIG